MVLRDIHNLADMIGIMSQLTIDRLHNRQRLASNLHRALKFGIAQRFERREERLPTELPLLHQDLLRIARHNFELGIAVATGLFTVTRQEIRPS